MRRYVQISGIFFALLALVQLTRTLSGWPVQVASVTVPIWASAVAFVITAGFATWALRAVTSERS
jgi:putative Ca2+/H+ antiporter (TMEM165/GDT1 family)